MGTRAVYTFIDQYSTFHVYKHWDGYLEGAAQFFTKSLTKAWPLPRYESSDFCGAFIAANKTKGGDIYLTTHWDEHGDLSYRYELSQAENGQLIIAAYEKEYTDSGVQYTRVYYGRLKDFVNKYGDKDIKELWNELDKSDNKLAVA